MYLKKLIVENQILLQTFTWDETMVNNAQDCSSIIFYPKITTGVIKSFSWAPRGAICNALWALKGRRARAATGIGGQGALPEVNRDCSWRRDLTR